MARIRSIKPAFCSSEAIAVLSIPCRLHFAMLWTYADDEGRGVDNPRLIKAAIWPLDDEVTFDAVDAWQAELAARGRIVRYEAEGRRYFEVANFAEHQKPQKPQPSKYPAPGQGTAETNTEPVRDRDGSDPVAVPPVVVGGGVDGSGGDLPLPSQSEIATPSDRVAKRSAVIDLLTDQALDARRSPSPIDDPDAYRSRVRAGMLTEHGDRAMQLVGSYPEWTIQRIAGELTRPTGDEDTATPKVLYAHADEQRHQRDEEALQDHVNSDPAVVAEARRAAREAIHRPPAVEGEQGSETVLSSVDGPERVAS